MSEAATKTQPQSKEPFYSRRGHQSVLILSLAVIILAILLPKPSGEKLVVFGVESPPLCVFRSQLDMDCPGCGLTRSFVSMGKADVPLAYHFHRIGPLFFLVFLFQIPYRALALKNKRWQLRDKRWNMTIPVVGLLMIANWFLNFLL